MKNIDADYYGYRDEDDGVIVPLERDLEEKREQRHLHIYAGLSSCCLRLPIPETFPCV